MRLIAVWGGSGAGKTAVSLAVASGLARQRQDVLVIGTDTRAPVLPVYLPRRTDLTINHSMGGLLELQSFTEGALKDRIHRHPGSEHLYVMGLVSGELAGISYKPPQRQAVAGLIQLLEQSPFQQVVVDCDASPVYDGLTLYALEQAHRVLRVATPDVKCYEFQKAQLAWLSRGDAFRVEQHLKLCNLLFPHTAVREAEALFGGFDCSLPYAAQVAQRMVAGELLGGFHDPEGLRFEARIEELIEKMEENNGRL